MAGRRRQPDILSHVRLRAEAYIREHGRRSGLLPAVVVLLRLRHRQSFEEIGCALSISKATVGRVLRTWRAGCLTTVRPGGRHNSVLTLQQEQQLLQHLVEGYRRNRPVRISDVQAAIAQRFSKTVSLATARRILVRGGWRQRHLQARPKKMGRPPSAWGPPRKPAEPVKRGFSASVKSASLATGK